MAETSSKKSSKKDRKEKKRRLSKEGAPSTGTKSKKIPKEEQASKKVKFEGSATTLKCLTFPSKYSTELKVEVEDQDPNANPILVSFPSGLPASMIASETAQSDDHNNDSEAANAAPVFTWTKVRKSATHGRILHGSDSTCTYTGGNDGRGNDNRLSKSCVCIYHKPTNTLQIYPSAEKGTVFALHQTVTSYKDSKSVDYSNLSMKERRRMVFESFGSNKKKKVLRSQDANVVEMKSVVGAGEGMMEALGKQWEGNNLVSDSNKKVIEELRKGSDRKVSVILSYILRLYTLSFRFVVHATYFLLEKSCKDDYGC